MTRINRVQSPVSDVRMDRTAPAVIEEVPLVRYRLVVMTNGRPCLRGTLEAFRELVTPQPVEILVHDDGGLSEPYGGGTPWAHIPWTTTSQVPAIGFCGSCAHAWEEASAPGVDFVFWIEDDIVVKRPVDLAPLADALTRHKHVTQMALMRQPVNDLEIAAGGCRELRPELYEEMDEGTWLRSHTNFSTGCSLIPRRFMASHPFPATPSCEGEFSIDLLGEGKSFGVWGLGESWVEHVGIRSGFGY